MVTLDGRVAVITGVSRENGIGYGLARRLAADGASLYLTGWRAFDEEMRWGPSPEGAVGALLDELRASGTEVDYNAHDLGQPDAPAAVIASAGERFGHVDILVADHARSSHQSLEALTAEEIDKTLAVNVRASLLLVQAFAAQHDGRPGGRVVLFTSGQYLGAMPTELPYTASKGALHQLTFSLAEPLMGRNITVNTVNPGPVDTGYATGEEHAAVAARFPRGRWGSPVDTARLVAWLVSDEADWVTGQVIASDGGFR
ncbi:MAG: 3-oxoacyl-[acyl-carrier protein] reductase [Acidimicrobiaceae bacterium]|jgi:3-oxoacyl-[acyl-carrier protein] reductase